MSGFPIPEVRDVIHSIPESIVILDSDGCILEYNDAWVEFVNEFGFASEGSVTGSHFLSQVRDGDCWMSDLAAREFRDVVEGRTDSFEYDLPCNDNEKHRWLHLYAECFGDDDQFVSITIFDNTDSKLAELGFDLGDSFINQQGVALIFDANGDLILADSRLAELTEVSAIEGRSYTELPGDLVDQIDSFGEIEAMVEAVLEGDLKFASTETTFRPLTGGELTVEIRIEPYQVDEYTNGAILTGTDVTRSQEQGDTLRLYERAIEGSTELLAAVDTDFRFLFANKAYREFFDFPSEEDVYLFDVIGEKNRPEVERMVKRVFQGETIEYSQDRTGADGRTHPFGLRYYPLRNREGTVIGAVAAIRDMTGQKEREQQLLVMDRVLRHNMNNDMNIITGNAELIRSESTGKIESQASTISETSTSLLDTVDKQRDIIELLIDPHRIQNLDVCNIVEGASTTIRERFPHAEIVTTVPDTLFAKTIPEIEQAIEELIDNAVNHGEDISSEVIVSVEETGEMVTVTIEDNGPGIPAEELGILTGEHEIEPLYHGSGMGLWLVNWIVSHSEGQLDFEENNPRGSRVSITLEKADGVYPDISGR